VADQPRRLLEGRVVVAVPILILSRQRRRRRSAAGRDTPLAEVRSLNGS